MVIHLYKKDIKNLGDNYLITLSNEKIDIMGRLNITLDQHECLYNIHCLYFKGKKDSKLIKNKLLFSFPGWEVDIRE